jgi:alpha-tubulin suppressor-like RCC1 family protein
MIIKTDGTLWVWGQNSNGTLGLNAPANSNKSSPVQIPGTTWSTVSFSYRSTALATRTDGTLWSWGYNDIGNSGINDRTRRSSPIQIPGTNWATGFGKISAGNSPAAIKTDGTLWSWGYNSTGTIGQNNRTNYSSPVQIPGTNWSKVSNGGEGAHIGAIKTDGTLWMWGWNNAGQCGANTSGDTGVAAYSSPVQVPGTNWSEVRPSGNHTSAIKTDGTLWVFGSGGTGQLGQNALTYASSPIQIPGTNWSKTSGGSGSTQAVKTDGTLWVWGNNTYGPLGQNNQTRYSSPVQVPGSWSDVISNNKNGGPIGAIKQ